MVNLIASTYVLLTNQKVIHLKVSAQVLCEPRLGQSLLRDKSKQSVAHHITTAKHLKQIIDIQLEFLELYIILEIITKWYSDT